ncbi:MAG: glycosyltransferase family 4 protein [Phycisphaera sp.]|nr:glycosyltransferase family 4 protein [Phycisphaera sp.]
MPILSLILIAIAIAVLALATSMISLAASKKRSAMEGVSPPPRRKPSGRSGRSVLRRLGSVARPLATLLTQRLKYRVVSRLYRAELERLRPDALHCHDLPMLPIGVSWRRDHPSVFLVFDSHELYEEVSQMTPIKRFFCQRLLRRASPMVDAFITVNDSIAGEHARRYPSLPSAVVVKNATIVDGEPLIRSDLLREAAGLDDDALVLLYQGGFAPHRGLERLIRAAASMPEPWVLVMMGWGNIEGNLKSIASEVDQDGRRIRFIPPAPQADLRAWTSGGDIGVIPYENTCLNHWFCSPNKLWEYPIAGVPMLVSPFPELKSAVEDHGIGICLPDELTNEGLSEVLSGITRDRLDAMKLACGRYIENDNWSTYAGRLIEMYTTKFPADRIGA